MIDEKLKSNIDAMSYEAMLGHWRFAEIGDPYFCGEVGAYYKKSMFEKRDKITQKEHVSISKNLGWEK
jgi:hypothetical protein